MPSMLSSGKERWRFETEGQITSSPAYANGVVYFGGIDGKVYSLEARNRATAVEFRDRRSDSVVAQPCMMVVVYIGSMDHRVYALKA